VYKRVVDFLNVPLKVPAHRDIFHYCAL